jgi:hypothetical protein
LQTENHAGQQRGDLRPYVTWNRFIDDGLGTRTRFDIASAFRPSLHPGCHSTPEKKREAQAFAAVSRRADDIAAQLLVPRNQILMSGRRGGSFAQWGFF